MKKTGKFQAVSSFVSSVIKAFLVSTTLPQQIQANRSGRLLLQSQPALPICSADFPMKASLRNSLDSGLVLTLLAALPPVIAFGLPMPLTLSLLASGGGMCLFLKRRSLPLGGLIGGLLYVHSLALLAADVHSGEWLTLAIFPFLLWRIDALRDKPTALNFIGLIIAQAALMAFADWMALVLTCLALAWVISEALVQHLNREASRLDWHSAALAVAAVLLSMGASALWRLPVLSATVPVQRESGLAALGLMPWALATVGFVGAGWLYVRGWRSRHPQSCLGMIFFALAALLMSASMPGLSGATAVCLAIAAGMNGLWLGKLPPRHQIVLIALFIALPMLTSSPLVNASPYPMEMPQSRDDAAIGSSLLSLLAIAAFARPLRQRQLTDRPYWRIPSMTQAEISGVLLGAATAFLLLLIH